MEQYLLACKKVHRLDEKTLKAYKCDLTQFIKWLRKNEQGFTKETIRAYLAYLNELFSSSTVKRKIASLRAFANYLEDQDGLDQNPFYRFRLSIREPQRLPKLIQSSELNKLFEAAYKPSTSLLVQKARDIAILEVLIATGLRVSELCQLNITDLSFDDKTLRVMGKGLKERIIQVENKNTLRSLQIYRNLIEKDAFYSTDETSALFLNRFGKRISDRCVRYMLDRLAKEAGLTKKITPHMFRHTFASALLENDVDIRYIQRLLGHSSIKTTEIYTHVASSKLRSILKLNNPRNSIRDNS